MLHSARFGILVATIVTLVLLVTASQASAITLGVGWSGNAARDANELPLVAASGATTFRIPQGAINDTLVEDAALNHVTILAQLGGGSSLPELTTFEAEAEALVRRYGANGSFWSESAHSGLPYEPITTWEIWNEPNLEGIAPSAYGSFVNGVAKAIHSAAPLGGSPEVLFGGILANGNLGPKSGTWAQMNTEGKGTTFTAALKYLEEAYGSMGSSVDGIALHPYENNEAGFYTPSGGTRYGRIEAFRYAVRNFHAKMVELAASHGGAQKSLSITEAGWPGAGNQWSVGGEAQQATLLGQAITFARENEGTLGIKNFDWYNYRDAVGQEEWAENCGLRASDGHFRIAWTEFQAKAGVAQFIPQRPSVETGEANEVTSSGADLQGSVNPNGFPTTYHFEYGTTTSYGSLIPYPAEGEAGRGGSAVAEAASLGDLLPNTTYHYRLVATNAVGTTWGQDRTFTVERSKPVALVGPGSTQSVFFRGAERSLWQGIWTGSQWQFLNLGGSLAGDPSPVVAPGGADAVFYRGSNGVIYQEIFSNISQKWETFPLGGSAAGDPVALVGPGNTQSFFYRGTNGSLWQGIWTGSQWQFFDLGFSMVGDPSPVVTPEGADAVFYRGSNDVIYQAIFNNASEKWESFPLGGSAAGDPVALVGPGNTQSFYYRGTEGYLWQGIWTGSQWQFFPLGFSMVGDPSPVVAPGGADAVFYRDANGAIYQAFYNNASGHWEAFPLATGATTDPSAAVGPESQQAFYYRGADNGVWQGIWTGTQWANFDLGGAH